MPKEDVELLIEGKIKLTNNLVYKLELILGLPKQFWINLENNYRNKLDIKRLPNYKQSNYKY